MEEQNEENFLEILRKGFEELVASGDMTEEKLQNGFEIAPEWLFSFFSSKDKNILTKTIHNCFIEHNPGYNKRCRYLKKEPYQVSSINIKIRNNNIYLNMVGNDDWTKLSISNSPNPNSNFLLLSPEEFEKRMYDAFLKSSNVFSKSIKNTRASSKLADMIKENQHISLNEMAKNLIAFYKYYAKADYQKENNIVFGGHRKRESEEVGPSDPKGLGSSPKIRVNPVIDWQARDDLLSASKPIIVENLQLSNGIEDLASRSYIYFNDDKCFIIIEPFNGTERTRLISLPKDKVFSRLQPGEIPSSEFWADIVNTYNNMGSLEFISQKHTASINHSDPNNYLKTLEAILSEFETGKAPGKLGSAVLQRVHRILSRVFGNEKHPDIKGTVKGSLEKGEVRPSEVDSVANLLHNAYKALNSNDEYSKGDDDYNK